MKTIFITLLALISFSSMAQDESVNGDLTIGKPNDAGTLKIKRGTAGGEVAGTIGFLGGGSEVHNLSLQSTSGGGYITFRTNYGGVAERLRIANNGYVGIGTNDPQGELHILGGSASKIRLTRGTGQAQIGMSSNTNSIFLDTGNDGSDLFINPTGYVGIGTPNPKEKLHLSSGDLFISSSTNANNSTHNGIKLTTDNHNYFASISTYRGGLSKLIGIRFSTMNNSTTPITAMHIEPNGNIGIGTATPESKLAVNGQIRATEVKVLTDVNSVPDYVFELDYDLRTLKETKEYITENKHLPEIPSAAEIGENGIDLGDMNMRLLKKIEELTLYQIELMEKLEEQQKRIEKLENK